MTTPQIDIRPLRRIGIRIAPVPFYITPILAIGRNGEGTKTHDLFVVRLENQKYLLIVADSFDDDFKIDKFSSDGYSLGFSLDADKFEIQLLGGEDGRNRICTRESQELGIYSEVEPDTAWPKLETEISHTISIADISGERLLLLLWQESTCDFYIVTAPKELVRSDYVADDIRKNPTRYQAALTREKGAAVLNISK